VEKVARELVRHRPPEETERATWTLETLGAELQARCPQLSPMSYETVRRWLQQSHIRYRRSKGWMGSPDPHYELKKHQRDRLLWMARRTPNGATVWLDESWFIRWPYAFRSWAVKGEWLTVPQRWNEAVDKVALFAALDDASQETLLYWAPGQPNSDQQVIFLAQLTRHYATLDKDFIALFWDKASWHTSRKTQQWIRAYNRRAKREQLPRLLTVCHPTRSPWLMPLEPIFGWVKHAVLGGQDFETVAELQQAVEAAFHQRVAKAKPRHDKVIAEFLDRAQKSRSVL